MTPLRMTPRANGFTVEFRISNLRFQIISDLGFDSDFGFQVSDFLCGYCVGAGFPSPLISRISILSNMSFSMDRAGRAPAQSSRDGAALKIYGGNVPCGFIFNMDEQDEQD